jgi:hypothetical protein
MPFESFHTIRCKLLREKREGWLRGLDFSGISDPAAHLVFP